MHDMTFVQRREGGAGGTRTGAAAVSVRFRCGTLRAQGGGGRYSSLSSSSSADLVAASCGEGAANRQLRQQLTRVSDRSSCSDLDRFVEPFGASVL